MHSSSPVLTSLGLASTPSCGTTTSRSTFPVSTGLGSAWSYLHRLSVKFCLSCHLCVTAALLYPLYEVIYEVCKDTQRQAVAFVTILDFTGAKNDGGSGDNWSIMTNKHTPSILHASCPFCRLTNSVRALQAK